MRWPGILRMRLKTLLHRRAVEDELDEELRYHFDREMEERMAAGLSRDEARWAALRSIGALEQHKEECRDMRGFNLLDNLVQDTRFAARQLRKSLGFTTTAVLMLALGMGASVAIFTFVDAALIKPLPYKDPARLVGVFETVPLFPLSNLSYQDFQDWKKRNKVFSHFDAFTRRGSALSTPSGVESVLTARVTDGFFRTLGTKPLLGRDFFDGEAQPAAHPVALLSYSTWQKRFSGKQDIVGQNLTMDGEAVTVIGVLPSDFHFAPVEPVEFWVALRAVSGCETRRSCHSLYGIARLKNGETVSSALADVKVIAKQLEAEYPDSNRDQGAAVALLTEVITGDLRPILLVLLGGSILVLLIAGVNAANLLLVRAESRRREMAVRSALGASKSRLVFQFVTESLLLVGAGGALGLVFSWWTIRLLTLLMPANLLNSMPFLQNLTLNGRVLAFAAEIALAALILFALTPVIHLSFGQQRDGLAEGSRGSAGTGWRRLGSKLVVLELATAVVLLVGAGLLGRSLYSLLQVDIGFRPEKLVVMSVAAPKANYGKDEQALALAREITRRMESLPGVTAVGITSTLPVGGNGNTTWFRVLGRPWHGEHNESPERDVTPGYFRTLGAKLIRGRFFSEADDANHPSVVIVNQAMARKDFPSEDAVGQRLTFLSDPPKPIEIVGIVDDIREGPLDVATVPALYFPLNQSASRFFYLVVRTAQSEQQLLPAMSAAVRQFDPGIVTAEGTTMRSRINDSPSAYLHRSSAWLVGGFALLALLLGVIGLYGVVAYSVAQRTREIGLRMAMGAQPGAVYRLILGEAGRLTGFGVVAGLVGAVGAATLIRKLLFGVESWDVATLATVAMVLGLASMLASFLPARRAARVNPVEALRSE